MKKALIIIGAIAILVIGYYLLKPKAPELTPNGTDCDPNHIGYQKDGKANSACGTIGSGNNTPPPPPPPFNAGDDVYAIPLRASYMYIYSYPQTNSNVEVGRTTNALTGNAPIGKYISMANNNRFVKVSFKDKYIQKKIVTPSRPDSFSYADEKVTGDYFVLAELVRNKPI